MTKKLLVAGLAVAVLGGGLLIASNMGFKLNYTLKAADGGVNSASGTCTIGLPYNQQLGLDKANKLIDDINATVASSVQNIQSYDCTNDSLTLYTGLPGDANDFDLVTGKGYFIKVGADVDYIIVGSHAPSAAVSLKSAGNGCQTGTDLITPPYHTTSKTAKNLIDELGGTGVVQNIQLYQCDGDTLLLYTGLPGDANDFTLTPGAAYYVKIGSNVDWTPAHF